jgi:hypothetical protein
LLYTVLVAVLLILSFVVFRNTRAAYGPPVTLCPGPDQYGYLCEGAAGYAYVDATQDTFLYQDDAVIEIDLPFPFTFYGTTYTKAVLSSNGNLQFGSANPWYFNECMHGGPVDNMGDMVAPYWDDLDLASFGFLELDLIGESPNRIFVVEWDNVPRFGENSDDRVTFELQLVEASNDIVFLYEDVTTLEGYNGSSATIGLQSEAQGLALQYGCDQPVVADASGLLFRHPLDPNSTLGLEVSLPDRNSQISTPLPAKGIVFDLMTSLNENGPAALGQLQRQWLTRRPARLAAWQWTDLLGDSQEELVFVWSGGAERPDLTQLAVLGFGENSRTNLLLNYSLSSRRESYAGVQILEAADLTGDGYVEVVLGDNSSGQMFVVSGNTGALTVASLDERCTGSSTITVDEARGTPTLARSDCETGRRVLITWNGADFEFDAADAPD